MTVTPAKAGAQEHGLRPDSTIGCSWVPAFAGMTPYSDRSSRLIRLRAGLAWGSGPRPPASSRRLTRA